MRDKGFTLIEMLVVIAMVGVLSAIAVPSWLAFVQHQRLSTAASYTLQAVRAAQVQAKTEKAAKSPAPVTEIHPAVTVVYPSPMLRFNHQGTVQVGNIPYRVNLTVTDSNKTQCVVVRTTLGAAAIGKDAAECDSLDNS